MAFSSPLRLDACMATALLLSAPEIWLLAGLLLLVMLGSVVVYWISLSAFRKRCRELSRSMERFVTSGFQDEVSFAPDPEAGTSPGFLGRMLSPSLEIAQVESAAELMVSTIRESKRRMLERERQHLDWLSFLCHDLGAPLRRVLTRIEALEYNEELTPKQAELALDSAHIEITHMALLIGSVNAFADAETDAPRQFEEISIDQLLEYTVAVFEFDAGRKSIELDLRIVPGIGPVRMEKLLIRRAIENLLSNAIRFTPVGGLISVRAERHGELVHISVADTGPGIPAEEIDRIFEFRYRGKVQEDSPRCGSLGLGLALVRRVAELHEGEVAVRNLDPEGAQFVISLPAKPLEVTGD
jgi:signal transduction histidine kinase